MTRKAAKRMAPEAGRDGNPLVIDVRRTDQDSGNHAYNVAEHPLEMLLHRRAIDPCQHMAGDRFRADYEKANIAPAKAVELKELVSGGGVSLGVPVYRLEALERMGDALKAVSTVSRLLILDVCVDGLTLEAIRNKRSFSRDYIGPRFREALDELSRHYGFS